MISKFSFLTLSIGLIFMCSNESLLAQPSKIGVNSQTIQLFNGKDLSNWEFKLKDPKVEANEIFYVQDGVIQIKGDPFGYMRTRDSYSDYKLHVEWRWPVKNENGNSGILIHLQSPDTVWPASIQI